MRRLPRRSFPPAVALAATLLQLCSTATAAAAAAEPKDEFPDLSVVGPERTPFVLKAGDVVAFVGGEAAVQEGEYGQVESLLAAAFPDARARFRNFAWEGDTVFDRPRDVNFPTLQERVRSSGATVIVCMFGQSEAYAGPGGVEAFAKAYEALVDQLANQPVPPRVVLVAPVPFEKPANPLLPDLEPRNADLQLYVTATRALAARRGWWCVDLFQATGAGKCHHQLTDNGMRPTPQGSGLLARMLAYLLGESHEGLDPLSPMMSEEPDASGRWKRTELEALRQAVVAKNRLWFDYSRPMNWAFLGGDRVQVPSSRDHRDPSVRWFPGEMERFVPLIEAAERRVDEAARKAGDALRPK